MPSRHPDANSSIRGSRHLVVCACLAILVGACGTNTSTPSPATILSPTPGQPSSGPSALDACDPAGLVACDQQAAFLSIPIADTGISLTWSSQWAPGRTDRPGWDASGLGLGGWSLDVVERYDATNHVLVGGDGSWRFVTGVALPSGGLMAVSSRPRLIHWAASRSSRTTRTADRTSVGAYRFVLNKGG